MFRPENTGINKLNFPRHILLTMLSVFLVILSFPPFGYGWLAWIAFVPILIACSDLSLMRSFVLGLLSGACIAVGIFWWVFNVPGFRYFHAIPAAIYVALYTGAWCMGICATKRLRLPLVLAAPAIWVALDFLKAHMGFLSLPWASLAHSQYEYPVVLQISAVTGEYGVTFLIIAVNAAVAPCFLRTVFKQQIVAAVLLSVSVMFGLYQLSSKDDSLSHRIAVVQPCIDPGELRRDPLQTVTISRLRDMTLRVAENAPELIAWPETAVISLGASPEIQRTLKSLSSTYNTTLVTGTSERVKFNDYPLRGSASGSTRAYNSAFVIINGNINPEPYRKTRLVPFGEYRPLERFVHWPRWFTGSGFQTIAGDGLKVFRTTSGLPFSILICWENLFPSISRQNTQEGAKMLVNLINDGWFGNTAAPLQHNSASVMRAVENGIPVIVASNCGPSQIIDKNGRILAHWPVFREGIIVADVEEGKIGTPYTRFGDWFAWCCVAFSLYVFLHMTFVTYSKKVTRKW